MPVRKRSSGAASTDELPSEAADASAQSLFGLFDVLADVYFYTKDPASRFTSANRNTLSTYDMTDARDLIGKSDRDFHPLALASAYLAEDRRVMSSQRPILNQLWLVPHVRGTPRWFISSKVPLFDHKMQVVGLAGTMVRVKPQAEWSGILNSVRPALLYLEQNFQERVSMATLARLCGLSSTSFNRHFRSLLHTTPTEYLQTLRVDAARRMLATSEDSLAKIAGECGFADQSHLGRKFRRLTGLTPLQYRRQFR